MPLVASVDYPNRRIYLAVDTADTDLDTMLVFKEVRAMRRATEAHRAFPPMIVGGGNVEKIAGQSYTQPYVQLLRGCRIVPYNASHRLRVIRDTFTDDGYAGRDCFDRTPLSASVEVDIDVDVDKVEVRTVATSGNEYTLGQIGDAVWQHASAAQIAARLAEVWGRLGLDASKPVTQGNTQVSFGDILLQLALDGNGNGTVTRQ